MRRGDKHANAEEAALCVARSPEGRAAVQKAAAATRPLTSEEEYIVLEQGVPFHRLGLDPGGVVAKEELLALSLSPDYRLECDICDRNYMLRRGCPCCRD